jgi:hypothetical protein
MRNWAAELVDRGRVREQYRVRAQDEAAPEEERPIVDRHERLANGDEQASVRASSSRHGFPQCHDRYNADDTDDDDSSFRQTAAHVTQRDAVVLPRDDRVQRDRGAVGRTPQPGLSYLGLGDAGPLLDAPAKEAYRRRLAEIDDDISEALATGDDERAAQSDVERDLLIRELTRAVGLGGRDRRAASASERARASVTRAVRQAIARIRQHHPTLGTYLDRAIRTGTYCSYLPDSPGSMEWKI